MGDRAVMNCWRCDKEVTGKILDKIKTSWKGLEITVFRFPASLCDECVIKEIISAFDEFAERDVVIDGMNFGPLLKDDKINWRAFVEQERRYRGGTYSENIFHGHIRILEAMNILRHYENGWFVSRSGFGTSNPWWGGFYYFVRKPDAKKYGDIYYGKDNYKLLKVSGGLE